MLAFALGTGLLVLLLLFNPTGYCRIIVFLLLGRCLWFAFLRSGVNVTLAGILLAIAIPIKTVHGRSPLKTVEDRLHPWVAFLIPPVFAFANSGVSPDGLSFSSLGQGLSLGIIAGLLLGKPIGVLAAIGMFLAITRAKLPEDLNWGSLTGVSLLAGIGFTMTLFIGSLAYETPEFNGQITLGVLVASGLSAVLGVLVSSLSLDGAKENNAG